MQNRLVFFLIVIAVIIAIAFFLFISFLTRGGSEETPPELDEGVPVGDVTVPPAGEPHIVGGVEVYIPVNPDRRVQLVDEGQQAPTQPPIQEQPTPVPTLVEPILATRVSPAPAAPAGSAINAGVSPITFISYVVQAEDTLYRITQKQQTTIELMAVHGIDSEDLNPGVTLQLPVANPNYCINTRAYVVRPRDTVFILAKEHNTTVETIASLNGLSPDYRIDINDVLCVP